MMERDTGRLRNAHLTQYDRSISALAQTVVAVVLFPDLVAVQVNRPESVSEDSHFVEAISIEIPNDGKVSGLPQISDSVDHPMSIAVRVDLPVAISKDADLVPTISIEIPNDGK